MISVAPYMDVRTARTPRSREKFAHCDFTNNERWGNPHLMKFRIRDIRKAKRMTIEQLAERVGTSKGYLSDLETGKRQPSTTMLHLIGQALKVPEKELYEPDTPQDALAIAHFTTFLDLSPEDQEAVARHANSLRGKAD